MVEQRPSDFGKDAHERKLHVVPRLGPGLLVLPRRIADDLKNADDALVRGVRVPPVRHGGVRHRLVQVPERDGKDGEGANGLHSWLAVD